MASGQPVLLCCRELLSIVTFGAVTRTKHGRAFEVSVGGRVRVDYLVLNLDTNHISDLARRSNETGAAQVLDLLQRDEARLGLSLFHMLELASPEFRSVDEVRALLRDVPCLFFNPFHELYEEEVASACARATGKSRRAPRAFAVSTEDWGFAGGPSGGTPLDMLDAIRQTHDTRERLLQIADIMAAESMMKDQAVLVRTPNVPLERLVSSHLDDHRKRFFDYADGLSAAEIIARVGGEEAFPAVHTFHGIMRQRLLLKEQKSTRNDMFDEHIALYAPYAAVTALDRATVARAKASNVPAAQRITRTLLEVPQILTRIKSGELSIVPSF